MIQTKTGDATSPRPTNGEGVIIAHICNDNCAWGRGFVLAVDALSPAPHAAYKSLGRDLRLGMLQFVETLPDVWVANMVAQGGVGDGSGDLVDYDALKSCLTTVFLRACQLRCSVHMPAGMGSGLAGGDKNRIHQIVRDAFEATLEGGDVDIAATLWEFTDTSAPSYFAGPDADEADALGPDDGTPGGISQPPIAVVDDKEE